MFIESVRITRQQTPATQALKPRIFHYAFHQPFPQALAAVFVQHKYVADVGIGGVVGDHTSKTDLLSLVIKSEAQRVLNGTCNDVLGNAFSPIAFRKKGVDRIQVQPAAIGTDDELAATILLRL